MLARVVIEMLNVRSTPENTADNIVGQLAKGQIVTVAGPAKNKPRWAEIDDGGKSRFVARRYLAQSPDSEPVDLDPEIGALVTGILQSATDKYDGIAYRLGCKARRTDANSLAFSGSDVSGKPCSGSTVDCSGWVSGLFQLVAFSVNAKLKQEVFTASDVSRLSNHSDGQIVGIGQATGQVYSGPDIDTIPLRSGLLFGINNGDYDWEGADRVFEIDHIVMGLESPDGYSVTQSSSSGGGVNQVKWKDWRRAMDQRFLDSRIHCVDLLATGEWTRSRATRKSSAATRAPNPLKAPPG